MKLEISSESSEPFKRQSPWTVQAANDPDYDPPPKPTKGGGALKSIPNTSESAVIAHLPRIAANDNGIEKTDNQRLPRGFSSLNIPQDDLDRLLKPNLSAQVSWAVFYLASIPAIAAANISIYAFGGGLLSATVFYPAALIMIARQQRGIETMVHDSSHGNWYRKNRKVNNFLANIIVAYPVLQSIERYWKFHREHHGAFGGIDDPCRQRYLEIKGYFAGGKILAGIIKYIIDFYKNVSGRPVDVFRFFVWHGCVYVLPLAFVYGSLTPALFTWVLFWLIPQITVLQLLRLVGELEEHDYSISTTECDATFSNIGFLHRWLVHPYGDWAHWIHHAMPYLPERYNGVVHRLALKYSPQYRNHKLFRSSLLGKQESHHEI